jgi:GDP-L-fucose synthase
VINVGFGSDVTIKALAQLIAEVVGFSGALVFDLSKPDGTPRKLMSSEKLRALGWNARIPLREGIASTYQWYLENVAGNASERHDGK